MNSQPELRVLLSREEIAAAVERLAAKIRQDYLGKHPILYRDSEGLVYVCG